MSLVQWFPNSLCCQDLAVLGHLRNPLTQPCLLLTCHVNGFVFLLESEIEQQGNGWYSVNNVQHV